jgi:hypothetical protein
MSRLTDKMNEIQRNLDIFSVYEFGDILRDFDEDGLSDLFINDIIVYLNEEKTKCLTVVLLDNSEITVQFIEENEDGKLPTFLTKNLSFEEMVSLIKTILRSYKIKKIQHG